MILVEMFSESYRECLTLQLKRKQKQNKKRRDLISTVSKPRRVNFIV